MTFWKTAFALLIVSASMVLLNAQEPHIVVTEIDSIAIPYAYDISVLFPNGDTQFYDTNYGAESFQVYGFQYLAGTNEFTARQDLGTVTGLEDITPGSYYWIKRYNKLYMLKELTNGITIIVLEQNNLSSHTISGLSFDPDMIFHKLTDLVSEEAVAIALNDSLVYYNFVNGCTTTLLTGADFHCSLYYQEPVVFALPESHFIYAKDSVAGVGGPPEVWVVFDSTGNYCFTQTSSNEGLLISIINKARPIKESILGKWYIPSPQLVMSEGYLECSFTAPDSLHIYFFSSQYPDDWLVDIYPFGNDKLFRMYNSEDTEDYFYYMLCSLSPLEQHPEPLYSFNFGYHPPSIATITEDITTLCRRYESSVSIQVFWTDDFPALHEFNFPASTSAPIGVATYAYNNILYVLNNQKIYTFNVDVSSAIADEDIDQLYPDFKIFPNPVNSSQLLTIESHSNQLEILDIYNIKGQKVCSLKSDSGKVIWNLHDEMNRKMAAGVYIIKQRQFVDSIPVKLLLLK